MPKGRTAVSVEYKGDAMLLLPIYTDDLSKLYSYGAEKAVTLIPSSATHTRLLRPTIIQNCTHTLLLSFTLDDFPLTHGYFISRVPVTHLSYKVRATRFGLSWRERKNKL